MPRKAQPKVVDMFAGAGLFSYAFAREGFEVIRAIEINPTAAATHRANLKTPIDIADVTSVRPQGRCDVLIAGPPCQGFSTLGSRRADDPRNLLCLQVAKWAGKLRPKVVVIENVAAFLDSPAHRRLCVALRRHGYSTNSIVLNAINFGVAQHRLRSFTIGSLVSMPEVRVPRTAKPRTVQWAWRGLPRIPDGENFHVARIPSELAMSRMKLIPTGGDKRDILASAPELAPPSWKRTHGEVTDVWGRLEWDEPSNTLRTCLLNASKGRYIHPDQHRVISIREAARLHSIPDHWRFVGTPYQIARQIGNSVPPLLGRAVAKAVRRSIDQSVHFFDGPANFSMAGL